MSGLGNRGDTGAARVQTGTVAEVRPDGSLLVNVLGGTGLRVRAIGDMRAGDPVVLLQADKQWVALGGRWAASDHTHPGKATGEWSYSTNTTIADPGSGNLRFSADGTQLAIAQVDNNGGDYLHVLSALAAEDTITMQETADAAKWAKYEVQGAAVDGGGWFTIDLALIESGGGGAPGNNRLVTVLFTYGVAGGDGGGGYVRRTGDTMTGDLHVNGSGDTGVWVNGMPLHRRPRVVVTANGGSLPATAAIWTWTQSGLPSHEGVQTSAMWNGSGRFQAPWDGLYRLEGTIRCDLISGGYPARFGGEILRNGTRLQLWGYGAANGGAAAVQYVVVTVGLLAGDYLQITIGSDNASGGRVAGGYLGTRVLWSYEGA